MGLLKYILKKFSCNSSCVYNANDSMSNPLSQYELKFKDIKKIMKILNKRQYIKQFNKNIEV